MKVSCCCFTCYFGDPEVHKDDEEERLIVDDSKPVKVEVPVKSPESIKQRHKQVAKKKSDTLDLAVEKNDKSSDEERIDRKVRILKKYHVEPANLNEHERVYHKQISETENISLKIGIKTLLQSGVVKIFALQASNVMFMLHSKSPPDTLNEDKIVVQLRTKVIPNEARGHSKKYEIRESSTGSMKFINECIHELQLIEVKHSKVRFRIYHVLKHHRDILLSEYILNLSDLDYESPGTVNVILEMHDPDQSNVKMPIISETRKSMSSISSIQSTCSANSSFHQDTLGVVEETVGDTDSEERKPESIKKKKKSMLKTIRASLDLGQVKNSQETGLERLKNNPVEAITPVEKMRRGLLQRSSKVSQLENKTDEMQSEAKNFSAVTQLLREKYQQKSEKSS